MTDTARFVVVWDVDGVLNPAEPGPDHVAHHYRGPAPTGHEPSGQIDGPADGEVDHGVDGEVEGVVMLHAGLAGWMQELTDAGARHAWATSWGRLAPDWLADRIGHPGARHWPVIDVPAYGGARFGHSVKWPAVSAWLRDQGDPPMIWFDDIVGGKDIIWADERTADGIPTLLRQIPATTGLGRGDIDTALSWISDPPGRGH